MNPKTIQAYTVPDGSFDPLRLALAFAATARKNGADFRPYHQVKGLLLDGKGAVKGVKVWDRTAGKEYDLRRGYRGQCHRRLGRRNRGVGEGQRPGQADPGCDGRL